MSSIVWACWDGGGNLTPSLGIAAVLTRRGHMVHFYGRDEMVPRVREGGLSATALSQARTDLDRYWFHPLPTVFGYTSSPAVGEELVEIVSDTRPDLVVVDAMFTSALQEAPRFSRPCAVMLHTFCYRLLDIWRGNFTMQSNSRERAGFSGLAPLEELWGQRDLLQVNTFASFDADPVGGLANVRYGAPVLVSESRAVSAALPWSDDDPTPIVMVSFSTGGEQRNFTMFQRALDALAPLPVHVVATTGDVIDPAELSVPPNAWATPFADHDRLLERASLVVGHGGHGTTMRALRHGRPIVGIPGLALDQVPNTQLIEARGAGRALPPDAEVGEIRAAATDVLGDEKYTRSALSLSENFGHSDGAQLAADAVEQLMTGQTVTKTSSRTAPIRR